MSPDTSAQIFFGTYYGLAMEKIQSAVREDIELLREAGSIWTVQ